MQLTMTGKQIDIGDALRLHIETSLSSILEKYFKTAIEAHVVVSKEAHLTTAEVSIHIGRGIVANAHAAAPEAHPAFDAAAERLAKQLRRYKRRLRDQHAKAREASASTERAMAYVLAPVTGGTEADDTEEEDAAEDGAGGAPAVIAEMSTELPNLTVGKAVMSDWLASSIITR